MRLPNEPVFGVALAAVLAVAAPVAAQQPPPAPTTTARPAPAATPVPADAKEEVASVNGETITKGDVFGIVDRYAIPEENQREAYEGAVDLLVNTKLLLQFLKDSKTVVPAADVDREIAKQEAALKQSGATLEAALKQSGTTMAELRDQIARRLQWRTYILKRATEPELRKFADQNKELFDGTMVRASHILLKVDPDAPTAAKEAARQKLLGIKQEIDSGKIGFADAANKYSEDRPEGESPAGGDLGYFPRRGRFATVFEPFVARAFAMKKGEVSDPVETEYGLHLIQVTDRMPGQKVEFDRIKDRVLEVYADDAQKEIVNRARKTAKVDVKPMPADFFPKAPATFTPTPAAPAAKPADAPK
jgi:parvulin-like peptidyl-prolyl isomerase